MMFRKTIFAAVATLTVGAFVGMASPAEAKRVWDIEYRSGGKIIQYNDDKLFSPDKTRICLKNRTGQPKQVRWKQVRPSKPITMLVNKGQQSCVTLPSNQTIEFDFVDRGVPVSPGKINLSAVRGDLLLFDWVLDAALPQENCGGLNKTPCKLWERIPSCDPGMVEDFLKGQCVRGGRWKEHQLANAKLAELGGVIGSQLGFVKQAAGDRQLLNAIETENTNAIGGRLAVSAPTGGIALPTGGRLRTMSVGASVGGKLIVGGSAGAGATHDLTGRLPTYAYATADYEFGLGFGANAGVDFGFWICQANKIGGDTWGVEMSAQDIIKLGKVVKGAADFKKAISPGFDIGVGLWFDYNNVFQGFTLTPAFGAGLDPGGYVRATTTVQDDPRVNCDGSSKNGEPTVQVNHGFNPFGGQGVQVIVYEHCDYQGRAVSIPNGRHNLASLRQLGIRNDDVSSIRVIPGNVIAIYEHDQFGGRRRDFRGDIPCLVGSGRQNFNDILSSAIVWRE